MHPGHTSERGSSKVATQEGGCYHVAKLVVPNDNSVSVFLTSCFQYLQKVLCLASPFVCQVL